MGQELAAENLHRLFFDAADIAPGNPQALCHLPLGEGLAPSQAVPQGDDLPLPRVQEGFDVLP